MNTYLQIRWNHPLCYLSLTPNEGNTTEPTNFYTTYIPSVFAQVTAVCSYPCHVLSCFFSQVMLTCADPVLACMVELGYHHRQTLEQNVDQCQAIQEEVLGCCVSMTTHIT
jgi:hypothetical protein